jgi:AraC family transcriptional regulator
MRGSGELPFGVVQFREVECPTSRAIVIDYERSEPVSGIWHTRDLHYFDMSLQGRPKSSRGCFVDSSPTLRDLGQTFFVPAGLRFKSEGGVGRQSSLNLLLPAHPLFPDEELLESGPLLGECLHLKDIRLRDLALRIAQEVREPRFTSSLLIEGWGLVLLGELSHLIDLRKGNRSRKGGLAPWRLRLIEDCVHAHPAVPTLAELAGVCSLSRRHLMRAFREETGQTLGAFVEAAAIGRAKRLLSQTEIPIAAIAAKAGFSSAAGFSVAFRRCEGQTPRAYRASRSRH